jgi:hypothetical protein
MLGRQFIRKIHQVARRTRASRSEFQVESKVRWKYYFCASKSITGKKAMKSVNKFLLALCGLVLMLTAVPANAQQNPDAQAAPASPAQVREEVHQLITDMQDPNYDFSKIPDRMRQAFQDFRSATDGMDPDTAQQFRQDLMTQLMPVLQANQQKIQEAIRMSFLKSLQTPLGCSDDEFSALMPYLEKVVDAFQATQVNRFRPQNQNQNGTQGPNQQRPNNANVSAVQQAASDLQDTLSDPSANSDLIKNKLDILRQAQDKAKQDLTVARGQLQALLTQRQEAVLVEYGLLD